VPDVPLTRRAPRSTDVSRAAGALNDDGKFNLKDFNLLAGNFGKTRADASP
jgi:hypothetical protein